MLECEQGCRQVQELAALKVLILIFSEQHNPLLFIQSKVDSFVSRYCRTCSRLIPKVLEHAKSFNLCDQSMSKYLYELKQQSSYHCLVLGSKIRKKSFFLSLKHFLERIYACASPPIELLLLKQMVLRRTEEQQHQESKVYAMYRQAVLSAMTQAKLFLQTKRTEQADTVACELQAILTSKNTSYGYLLSQLYYLKACICQRKGQFPVQELQKSIKNNGKNKAAYVKIFEYLLYPFKRRLIEKYLRKYSECVGNDSSFDAIRAYLSYQSCITNAALAKFDQLLFNIKRDPELQHTYSCFNYCLGLIEMEKRKSVTSLLHFEKEYDNNPNNYMVFELLVQAMHQQGQWLRTQFLFQQFEKTRSPSIRTELVAIAAFLQLSKREKALTAIEKIHADEHRMAIITESGKDLTLLIGIYYNLQMYQHCERIICKDSCISPVSENIEFGQLPFRQCLAVLPQHFIFWVLFNPIEECKSPF